MQLLLEWKPTSSASQSQRGVFLQNVLSAFHTTAELIFIDVINDMVSGTGNPKYELQYDKRAGGAKVRISSLTSYLESHSREFVSSSLMDSCSRLVCPIKSSRSERCIANILQTNFGAPDVDFLSI